MNLYLPIAEMPANVLLLLALGGSVGFLSGLFGIGGGFLMTPFLILMGVPAPVAVATNNNQVAAAALSSLIVHLKRGKVDFAMSALMIAGGLCGSFAGVRLVHHLTSIGQIDLTIRLLYALLFIYIGGVMLNESLRSVLHRKRACDPAFQRRRTGKHFWVHGLPFKFRFRVSGLYISALVPLLCGASVGIVVAIMGINNVVMIPMMIYLIGMPASVVVGTSMLQVCVLATFTTFMQAYQNHSVDIILALPLIAGGVIGAQLGVRAALKINADSLRLLLAALILLVALRLVADLLITPDNLFALGLMA